jgi:hypothetical protein
MIQQVFGSACLHHGAVSAAAASSCGNFPVRGLIKLSGAACRRRRTPVCGRDGERGLRHLGRLNATLFELSDRSVSISAQHMHKNPQSSDDDSPPACSAAGDHHLETAADASTLEVAHLERAPDASAFEAAPAVTDAPDEPALVRVPSRSELDGLLSHLKFGQVVQKINAINAATASRLSCAGTELQDFEQAVSANGLMFELPRIVVIGDEKSGKSSTVERLAMAPVFPRQDETTMTRMPILLKLRFAEQYPSFKPLYVLSIPPCSNSRGSVYNQSCVCDKFESTDSDEIIALVRKQMVAIEESNVGIESDREIVIEMHSSGVPSIDMVDLPGAFLCVDFWGVMFSSADNCARQVWCS